MIMLSYIQMILVCFMFSQVVVSAKNPIHRIASQVIVFMMGAFIFMLLDYYFQGLTYIIVYVGAIAIQFQFVIMMVSLPSGSGSIEMTDKKLISPSRNLLLIERYVNSEFVKKNRGTIIRLTLAVMALLTSQNFLHTRNISIYTAIIESIKSFNSESFLIWINDIIAYEFNNLFGRQLFNTPRFYSYYSPKWSTDYVTITDIESQALQIYTGYPTAQIQISIAQWTVMIGIISICSPRI